MYSARFSLRFLWLMAVTVGLLVACNEGTPQREVAEPQADGVFLDYQATGDEERGEVTVRLQFRLGGPEGQVILLDSPAAVYFDGQPLEIGTTKMNGSYYEAAFAAGKDVGKVHEIHYISASGTAYKDSFYFPFFQLSGPVPDRVTRDNGLDIKLSGLKTGTPIHAMLTDTSFYGRGIDRVDSIEDGGLRFSPSSLQRLKNGPIHIEFYREDEQLIRRNTLLHGRLYLSYSMSREFELVD